MASSSSSSESHDTEEAVSESGSHDSVSVEYFSCEDTAACEDTTSWEDTTSKGGSLVHLLPPIQGTGGRESKSTPIIRRYKIQDEPKQDPKVSIALAWEDEDTESVARVVERLAKMLHTCLEKLKDGEGNKKDGDENQKHERDTKKNNKDDSVVSETIEGEVFQPRDTSPLHMAQVSHQEYNNCQESSKCKSAAHDDVLQFPELPLMFKEQDLTETMSQVNDSRKINMTETAWVSSVETEETTTCLSLRRAFHWMREQALCCLRRRNPGQATQRPH